MHAPIDCVATVISARCLSQHAAERSALERSISSLERKLQAASKEVEHRGQCESLKAQIRSDVQGAAVDMARMVRELHVKFLDSQTTQMASLSVSFEREKVCEDLLCELSAHLSSLNAGGDYVSPPVRHEHRNRCLCSARQYKRRPRRTTNSRR